MDFQHDVKTYKPSLNPDGSMHFTYTGSAVILPKVDFNALMHCKSKVDMCVNTSKQALARANNLQSANEVLKESAKAAVQNASEDFLSSHRGGYDKQGCGRRAEAEILAKAVSGASIAEIQKCRFTYDRYGHKRAYGRDKIFKALSVKRESDYNRIVGLLRDFPTVFEGISYEQVFAWMQKKASKGGKKS